VLQSWGLGRDHLLPFSDLLARGAPAYLWEEGRAARRCGRPGWERLARTRQRVIVVPSNFWKMKLPPSLRVAL
jgi:hypothetical protein